MKALSLWQPYADLIAMEAKTLESRFWETSYRGPVLICAAKSFSRQIRKEIALLQNDTWCLNHIGRSSPLPLDYQPKLGVAVAVTWIVDCRKMTSMDRPAACFSEWRDRFVFVLERTKALDHPFPVRGHQKFFFVEPPGGRDVLTYDSAFVVSPDCSKQGVLFK